jgi:tRNA A-37 threonylcarbamoyl transferase component Bud32
VSYDVVGLLGRGGSAVVELAVDGTGRLVATKRVPLTGSAEQIHTARVRLRREAEILGSLAHPGILPVLDIVDDGADVILVLPAMAENLEDRVGRLGPFPTDEVIALGRVLLEAVAAAHRLGVVHRDIKPANVLFDRAGHPALADFGAASSTDMTAGLTAPSAVFGTPMWMAPEQAMGAPAGPAADLFALGATLTYAATGNGPYAPGPPLAVLERAARREVLPVPATVTPPLRAALRSMLDPDPARRPSAAGMLGGVGGTMLAPVAGAPARPVRVRAGNLLRELPARILGDPRPGRRPRRWSLIVAAALALLGAAALAAAVVAYASSPNRPGAPGSHTASTGCTPRPYQPCGSVFPAPHTNGTICDPGWYDLDGSPTNGCESRSDYLPGTALTSGIPVRANLVPAYTTDTFVTHVSGHATSLCWGTLNVTITAPAGTAEKLTVSKGGRPLATALSADGAQATASVDKPSCLGSDSEDLTVTVTALAGNGASVASDFTLTRDGGW